MEGEAGRGLFIAVEGVDGVGKTTQIELLAAALRRAGHRVRLTQEPEGTPLGEGIGRLLRAGGAVPRAEALLFCAARAQHVDEVLRPALARGETVVCSRYTWSTLAYQCFGLELDESAVAAADSFARDGLWPDVYLVLDLPRDAARRRLAGRTGAADSIEARAEAFHERVRAGFLALAAREPARARVIDASGEPEAVHEAVWAALEGWR